MTYLDLSRDCHLDDPRRAKKLAIRNIPRLHNDSAFADLEPEEVQKLRAIYQSEVNRRRIAANPDLPGLESGEAPAVYIFDKWRVRIVLKDRKPWFVAKDVAEALGYPRFDSNLLGHIPEKWKGTNQIRTPGGEQSMLVLSLEGLFHFLNRSDKPAAQPFQEWVNGTVLVSIHETGHYEAPKPPEQPKPPRVPSCPNNRLPAALVREYRLALKDKGISASDFQLLIGLPSLRAIDAYSKETIKAYIASVIEQKASPEQAAEAFAELGKRFGGDRPGHEREEIGAH